MLQINDIINLSRYPIDLPDSNAGHNLVRDSRDRFQVDGLCMLPGFVRQDALNALVHEANEYQAHAWYCDSSHNAYLSDGATDPSHDAVGHLQEHTIVGSVPYDRIPDNSALKAIYHWDPLRDFIATVLGKEALYRLEDPFGACSVNVFNDGGVHGWHFDESEFSVTLMLQAPDSGGEFEYAPSIRGHQYEPEIIRSVLSGERERVVTLPFTPGTLLIFGGHKTLHRVTRVSGSRPRLVPVLCYSEQPGMHNSESVRKLFWGRANPGDTPAITAL